MSGKNTYQVDTGLWADRLMAVAEAAERCDSCEGGGNWYVRKYRWIARHKADSMSMDQATAIYAVLSTNASVAENDKNYLRVMRGERAKHFGTVLKRVHAAKVGNVGEALVYRNAAKVTSFAGNLRFPWRAGGVTVDRHAGDILTNDRKATKAILAWSHLRGYRAMESVYQTVAAKLGILPHELQARTWVHWVECMSRDERTGVTA